MIKRHLQHTPTTGTPPCQTARQAKERHPLQLARSLAGLLSRLVYLCALSLLGPLSQAQEEGVWEKVESNVRIMRNQDGTTTELRRSSDETVITKRNLDVNGKIVMTTIYRLDDQGNLLRAQVYDGAEVLLYKVRYGYHKKTGQLVAEDMFDARVPRTDPESGKEIPVRRIYYQYDAAGNQSKPISFVFVSGKYAEEVYDMSKSSFLHDNPFENNR